MYKLIAFDMDDTLCPAKNKADNEMIGLLEKLLDKYKVAITSGGMFENIKNQILCQFTDKVKLENLFLLPTNSARMFCYNNGEWGQEYNLNLSDEEIDLITKTLDNAILDLDLKPKENWGEIVENRGGSQITYSALGQKAPLEAKRVWDPDKKIRLKISEYIKNELKDYNIGIGGTTSIDVTRKGIDKSYGIYKMMDLYDIESKEILYVGDALFEGGNDYVVIKTGIDTKKVDTPSDTKEIILKLI